eukprot:m.360371 g.360371  ORF g.360371 m.360371 type:complete len:634 (+) comp19009_c0_seq1:159-2060(+)
MYRLAPLKIIMDGVWSLALVAIMACMISSATALAGLNSAYHKSARPVGTSPLFVVSDSALNATQTVTIETLAGGLARDTPQIYRVADQLNSTSDSYAVWLDIMRTNYSVAVNTTFLNSPLQLLQYFAPRMRGMVLYDPATNSTNAAITYCAGAYTDDSGRVVVAVGDVTTQTVLSAANVPVLQDLTATTVADVYNVFRANFSHQMASFQPASKSGNLAEYAVFSRAPTMEYLGDDGGETVALVAKDIHAKGPNGIAMGWGPENQYVSQLGKSAMYVHASDWSMDVPSLTNLNVHSSVKHKRTFKAPHSESFKVNTTVHNSTAKADKKHTVTFLMTDGDNVQWLLGPWAIAPDWFGSPLRGKVPIGWTVTPALVSVAPLILDYIYSQATENDSFVTGPSGVGYIYPDSFDPPNLDSFASMTSTYMEAADMRIVNIINNEVFSDSIKPLAQNNQTDAVFLYTYGDCYSGGKGAMYWSGSTPIITGRATMWGNGTSGECLGIEPLVSLLKSLPKDPTSPDGYSLIPVNAWSHNTSDIVKTVEMLEEAGGFSVVTPRDFVAQIKTNVKPDGTCPTPSGSYSASCNNCTIDKLTCLLSCTCDGPSGSDTSECNLRCCSNLSNNNGLLWCDNQQCPTSC